MAHRRSSGEVRPYVRSSKPRFNWTGELKLHFEEAMAVLGGTRKATPKQIRELMKCPHIQLSHIKSRLQMCRIRMEEKERRSGSNSSEELQMSRRREVPDNVDANGDDRSVVVDESEANDNAALSLSMPSSSLESQSQHLFLHPSPHSDQRPLKRLRLGQVFPGPSSSQSPERTCDAATFEFQYYFDYFGTSRECGAGVADFPTADIFREEQSNVLKKLEQRLEEEKEEEELQLSLSLSMPGRAKLINLDLSM